MAMTKRFFDCFAKEVGIDYKVSADGYLPFESESFAMVMAHDVLEHLHDSPRGLINDLSALIKPNGYLFITVPNAVNIKKRINVLMGKTNMPNYTEFYWYPGSWRGHVREYVKNDLRLLAEFIGFEIVELKGCHHMLEVVPAKLRKAYMLVTNVFPGWRDSWLLVAKKPENWQPRKKLSDAELAKLIGAHSPYYRDNAEN